MSRLLVVVTRGAGLVGAVADSVQERDGHRVFTLRGQEVVRVRDQERYVVRPLPGGRFAGLQTGSAVAEAG